MQCVPELHVGEGAAVSYNFLHLTVQEYLTAFHLSQQPVEKQIEHFRKDKDVKKHQHHFHMVLRFLCGITQFEGYSNEQLNIFRVEESDDDLRKVTFDMLHWLFESRRTDIIAELLGSTDIHLDETNSEVLPSDCFVLGYCVSHSNCTWKKVRLMSCIEDEKVEMLVQGAVEEKTNCTGGISEIVFSWNGITTKGLKHLLKLPKQLKNKLEKLNLYHSEFNSKSCTALACFISDVPHLKKLYLSSNPNIGQGGAVALVEKLTTHNSLEGLSLDKTGIGVKDCRSSSK